MALECRFTSDGLGVISEYSGQVTNQDLIDACNFRIEHIDEMRNIRYNIADYRATKDFEISTQAVRDVAKEATRSVMPHLTDVIYIAVVRDDVQFGTMRMWSSLSDHENINNIVVKDDTVAQQKIAQHLSKLGIKADVQWDF